MLDDTLSQEENSGRCTMVVIVWCLDFVLTGGFTLTHELQASASPSGEGA